MRAAEAHERFSVVATAPVARDDPG